MARKTREELLSNLAQAQEQLKAFDKAEGERIGKLAIKSGLNNIAISEEQLAKEFDAIVKRFRAQPPKVEEPKATPRRDPELSGGGIAPGSEASTKS